ncbi:MAG: cation:proton antiporter [Clostridia bacterium]|nr:cation:proton antiporter [Clostridia bacterium]
MEFEVTKIIYYLAVILFATNALGMATRKLGLPQVVGMVIAGLLIGPAIFSQLPIGFGGLVNPTEIEMDVLRTFSQVGVILILFSSGLETDLKDLKTSGFASSMIALAGVIVPLVLGTLVAALFMGGIPETFHDTNKLLNALFVGCILTATSVGITVETLRELGKLNSKLGTTVLSAAIIDDVIGIIVLSLVTSLNGSSNPVFTLLKAAGFFAFSIGLGIVLRIIFKWISEKYPHKRRTGIFALSVCFIYAYCSEEFFGIAAITGAYMAGVMLSGLSDTKFVDKKILVNGYMIFSPIFFAFIGISADFSNFRLSDIWFALAFVAIGVIAKIIGCGLVAKLVKFTAKESLAVGCGMIARGEVALAVYSTASWLIYFDKGGNLVGIDPLFATIMLIISTSILCPILLKVLLKNSGNDKNEDDTGSVNAEDYVSVKAAMENEGKAAAQS